MTDLYEWLDTTVPIATRTDSPNETVDRPEKWLLVTRSVVIDHLVPG
jgi:hypothetical protein